MINKQTTLDLNGPILSFTQQPSSVTIDSGDSTTFVGVATVSYPTQDPVNPAVNTGSIAYQWYVEGYGALSDGTISNLGMTVAGSATTTLSITNATNPAASLHRIYLSADLIPSAYSQPTGAAVTVGTARSTGNASVDPKISDIATLTVRSIISVTSNPSSVEVAEGFFANFSASGSSSDGSPVSYRWQLNGSYLSDNGSTVFGSSTSNLRISRPTASLNTVRAEISHPTASNSPIYTSSANLNVVSPRAVINYESYIDTDTSASTGSFDLKNGNVNFGFVSGAIQTPSVTVYSPERDINVRITLAAAAGGSYTFGNTTAFGGGGGVTVFNFTLRKNTEYVFKIGSSFGGGISGNAFLSIGGKPNGGGSSIMYRGSQVLVVSGGGGGAGIFGNGGAGGAAGQNGRDGSLGRYPPEFGPGITGTLTPNARAGAGGYSPPAGTLGTTGYFGRSTIFDSTVFDDVYAIGDDLGGKLASCLGKGSAWLNRGYSLCEKIGFEFARNVYFNIITGTTDTIERGYKATGPNYIPNGGWSDTNGGGAGGSGAYGGSAATGPENYSGGGGGSGYTNGEAAIISRSTGGNSSQGGYVTIELVS